MKAKKKPLVGTWYAVRYPDMRPVRWLEEGGWYAMTFKGASLFPSRKIAKQEHGMGGPENFEIVPVRCRPLTSKKRNKKRTR